MNQLSNSGINKTLSSLSIVTFFTFGFLVTLDDNPTFAQNKKANVQTSNLEPTDQADDAMELPGIFKVMPQASTELTQKSSQPVAVRRISIPGFTGDSNKAIFGANLRRTEKKPAQAIARSLEKRDTKTVIIPSRTTNWDNVNIDNLDNLHTSDFHATAYCLKGRTASGEAVRQGFVAADPKVLPLGTLVHIQAGRYTGVYKVADTGGSIKGRKIDIYVPSYQEARLFGRQKIQVKVLGRRK
jgi:3D (Asp-Asp-Asp) domain-containing protein